MRLTTVLPCIGLILHVATPSWALTPNGGPQQSRGKTSIRVRGDQVSLRYIDDVQQRVDRGFNPIMTKEAMAVGTFTAPLIMPKVAPLLTEEKEEVSLNQEEQSPNNQEPSETTLVLLGCVLAANSGFLNGLTLSGICGGTGMACAAVTGAWTNGALRLASGNLVGFGSQVAVLVAYFLGSFWNGMAHPEGVNWTPNDNKSSRTLLWVAALVGLGAKFHSIPLLAMANGWQNSWTSMLIKGNVIRSAHFSGITSDMGTAVGQMIRLKRQQRDPVKTQQLLWKVAIQLKIVSSFFAGGLLSVAATNFWGSAKTGLLASVAIYLGCFGALALRQTTHPLRVFRRVLRKRIKFPTATAAQPLP